MTPSRKKSLYLSMMAIATLGLLAASFFWLQPSAPPASDKIQIAATIFPLADIARQIGGESVDVEMIIPPGVTEHSANLTPQQLQSLQSTKVIFQIGNNLDSRLTKQITAAIPSIRVVTVDKGIALREFGEEAETHEGGSEEEHEHDTGVDPHYWLTVPNAKIIAQTISETLIEVDPENSTHYQLQTINYLKQLDDLEIELMQMSESADQKQFIAMHNAWSYFTEQYGFTLVATYEPIEGKEPTVSDIQHLQEIVAEHGLTTFYSEPQKETSAAIRFLREDLHLEIKVLDPVGGVSERNSYLNLMRANMQALTAR